MLKSLIQSPRPFWVDPLVKPASCSFDYGNPSGHVFNTGVAIWGFLTYFFRDNNLPRGLRFLLWLASYLVVFLMMQVRYFQGLHSLAQVCNGAITSWLFTYAWFNARFFIRLCEDVQSNSKQIVLFCIVLLFLSIL